MKIYLLFGLFLIISISCNHPKSNLQQVAKASFEDAIIPESKAEALEFKNYWYQGKAEISRYELLQHRYGDIHPGEAVLIFVTEDFLLDKQVKNDQYSNPKSTSILKNNMIRQFSTGIYDYSMMTSVFTPINQSQLPHTLKITTSSQDWCGQTFEQLNLKQKKYQLELRSYFESEADQDIELDIALLEDELFNRIRMNPNSLPEGKIKVIPSTQISRLMHLEIKEYVAEAIHSGYSGQDFEDKGASIYKIYFPELKRNLEIVYESNFPYKIIGWTDSYPSKFDKEIRTTIARKTHERYSAYWQENSLKDMGLREELGLQSN